MTSRNVMVTGASRGIGRAIAVALGGMKANVVVNYNSNQQAAEETAGDIVKAGGKAIIVKADVGNLNDHARLLEEASKAFGAIDLLVNNAGIAPKVRADMLEMQPESFDGLLSTNLRGPYFLTQRVAKQMIEDRSRFAEDVLPAIVNISSISAFTVSVNRAEYCIAKAGLSMMTQLFAARLAEHRIHVYEIRPGVIATDMTGPVKEKYDKLIAEGLFPIRRWGQPADIAMAVVAIAEGRLSYSTGQVLEIDGGFHIPRL